MGEILMLSTISLIYYCLQTFQNQPEKKTAVYKDNSRILLSIKKYHAMQRHRSEYGPLNHRLCELQHIDDDGSADAKIH